MKNKNYMKRVLEARSRTDKTMATASDLFEILPGRSYALTLKTNISPEEITHTMKEFESITGSNLLVWMNGASLGNVSEGMVQTILQITAERVVQQLPYYSGDGVNVPIDIVADLITGKQRISTNQETTPQQ